MTILSPLAVAWFRRTEWTMGNGQCEDCYGQGPNFGPNAPRFGHAITCPRAAVLRELGLPVAMRGQPLPDGAVQTITDRAWRTLCKAAGIFRRPYREMVAEPVNDRARLTDQLARALHTQEYPDEQWDDLTEREQMTYQSRVPREGIPVYQSHLR